MKALRLQVLHTCDGSPSLSVNTTRNISSKRPRRLACFASTVNKMVACFASSSERQKRQRYFKPSCTRRLYIFCIFSRYNCLLHTSINYTENVRIFTRICKQWIPGALLRFFKRLGTRLFAYRSVWGHDIYLLQCCQALVHSQSISKGSGSKISNFIPFKTVEESTPKLVQVVKIN